MPPSPAASLPPRSMLDEIVPELAAAWGVPGVAIALANAGGEVMTAGYGVTNVEHPLAVDGRTLFQIGSVTKTLTATLVLQDVAAGRLGLDDPVALHLDGFSLADGGAAAALTVRHLLTHRGGFMGDFLLRFGGGRPGGRSLAEGVAALAESPQLFPPGEVSSYNNGGFALLGRLVEVLSGGRPWYELVRERVLEPAGMTHTYATADEVVTHRVAAPHGGTPAVVLRGKGWQPGWGLVEWDWPVGGLVSCVDDLAAWLEVQLSGGRGRAGQVLDADWSARAHAAQASFGALADEVGLCWLLRRTSDGRRVVGHSGQTVGYETDLLLLPELGVGLAVCTNAAGSGSAFYRALRRQLLQRAFGVVDEPPSPEPGGPAGSAGPAGAGVSSGDYVGTYELPFARAVVSRTGPAGERLLVVSEPVGRGPGWWNPPLMPPVELALYEVDRAVAVSPPVVAGTLVDFGRRPAGGERGDAAGEVVWMRLGGRAGARVERG